MPPILSGGAISLLFNGDLPASDIKPVLQVAEIIHIKTQNEISNCNTHRYKILLSDGAFSHEAILDPRRSDLVRSGKLQKGSVVQLNQFMFDFSQNRLLVLIIDLDVLLDKCDLIGEPKLQKTNKRPMEENQSPPRSIPTPLSNPYKRRIMTPPKEFHFRTISDLESMEDGSIVDLIGVVSSISQPSLVTTKTGDEIQKRTLQLNDMSGRSVELTLWQNFCNDEGQILQGSCDSMVFPVLALKSCKVRDFNGKVVWTISTTQLLIEPNFPEANILKVWFHDEGKNTIFASISKYLPHVRKTISQIKDERLGMSEKPHWVIVCAALRFIKLDKFYKACPVIIGGHRCNKKVIDWGDGKWRCNRCDRLVEECDYRCILKMQIQDHTGSMWITVFQESGEEILGISSKDLYDYYMRNEEQRYDTFLEAIHNVLFTKYLFKLKLEEEIFQGEKGVKPILLKTEKVNFQTESMHLLDLIAKSKGQPGSYGDQCVASTSRVPFTGLTSMDMSCNDYGAGNGDELENRPSGNRGHLGKRVSPWLRESESLRCFKCHLFGHWARDCPGLMQ